MRVLKIIVAALLIAALSGALVLGYELVDRPITKRSHELSREEATKRINKLLSNLQKFPFFGGWRKFVESLTGWLYKK